jgi:hypothetical protein
LLRDFVASGATIDDLALAWASLDGKLEEELPKEKRPPRIGGCLPSAAGVRTELLLLPIRHQESRRSLAIDERGAKGVTTHNRN